MALTRTLPVLFVLLAACDNSLSGLAPIVYEVLGPGGPGAGIPTGTTTITVNGERFEKGAVVTWNGTPLPTTFVGASVNPPQLMVLTAKLDPAMTAVAGTASVNVSNPDGLSAVELPVRFADGTYALTSLSPNALSLGGPDTMVSLTGTGFAQQSVVLWNGSQLEATFVDSHHLSVLIPHALQNEPSIAAVQVRYEPCCISDTLPLPISVGAQSLSMIALNAQDLAWDATHALLFVDHAPDSATSKIASVNPATGAIGAVQVPGGANNVGVALTSNPFLGVSAGAKYLYVSGSPVMRYLLPDLSGGQSLSISADEVLPSPTDAEVWAALSWAASSVRIANGASLLSKAGPGCFATAWGASSSSLYCDAGQRLAAMTVDATGVAQVTTQQNVPFREYGRATYLSGRIYGDDGENYDLQGGDPRPFVLPANRDPGGPCRASFDQSLGKAFFACLIDVPTSDRSITYQTFIYSFDLVTQAPLGKLFVGPGRVGAMARWGTNGLALAQGSSLTIYSGDFVH